MLLDIAPSNMSYLSHFFALRQEVEGSHLGIWKDNQTPPSNVELETNTCPMTGVWSLGGECVFVRPLIIPNVIYFFIICITMSDILSRYVSSNVCG